MNLTEFRMRAMNDEVQMIEDFNFFEQKVASFKKDLYLSPYAKINEILHGVSCSSSMKNKLIYCVLKQNKRYKIS